MVNTFNRNDGTFAQVSYTDLSGSPAQAFTVTHAALLAENATSFGYILSTGAGALLTDNGAGVDPTLQGFSTAHAALLSSATGFAYAPATAAGNVLTDNGIGNYPTFTQGVAGITGGGTPTAGNIGELIDSGAVNGTSLGSGTLANLTSIAVSAGSWDTFGYVVFHFATNAGSAIAGGQSTSAGAFAGFIQFSMAATLGTGTPVRVPAFNQPWSIAGTTNLFLNVQATFGGTCTADGRLWARRVG